MYWWHVDIEWACQMMDEHWKRSDEMSKNDGLAQAVGTSVDLTLKGRKLKVRPLTLGDLADFEGWAKGQQLAAFRVASEGMDDTQRMLTLASMSREAVPEEIVQQSMQSIGGVRYLLGLILRTEDGKAVDDLDQLVDLSNLSEVTAVIYGISGIEADDANPPEPPASSN